MINAAIRMPDEEGRPAKVKTVPGGRPPKSKTGPADARLHIRITPYDKEAINRAANAEGMSLTDWVTKQLRRAARHHFSDGRQQGVDK